MKKILTILLAVVTCMTAVFAQQGGKQKKVLIVYFSATGTTATAAGKLAEATGGELLEIEPEERYNAADLDWRNEKSRCYVEMHDLKFRPAIKKAKVNMADYDTVYIGFPIWWNIAPTIVNTFIEAYDLKGKTVVPFATSGGSTIDNSVKELKKAYPAIDWQDGKLLNRMEVNAIREWVKNSFGAGGF